jgi:hypothetical protein
MLILMLSKTNSKDKNVMRGIEEIGITMNEKVCLMMVRCFTIIMKLMMGGSMIRRKPIRLDLTHRQFEALQLACECMRQNIMAEFDQPHEYRYYDRYTVRTFNNLLQEIANVE